MKTILTLIAALGLLFVTTINAGEHHTESPSFKSNQLTDNIYMLQGKGGNLGLLVGENGLLLIDADYKIMSDALTKQLDKFGGVKKLNYLINTHWHGDHTEGNFALGHHAQIIAHDNVRARLLTTREIKLFNMVSKPYPQHALPAITYSKRLSLHINNENIQVIHFPSGHTDGDSVVFFKKSNIIHMGDLFFSGMFPFVDIKHGGNVLNMANNIQTILGMVDDKTKIIPGHGALSNKADLQAFHNMLVTTSAEVKAMMDKGMTLEQIQAKGLSKQWTPWTARSFFPEKVWIEIVHSSL